MAQGREGVPVRQRQWASETDAIVRIQSIRAVARASRSRAASLPGGTRRTSLAQFLHVALEQFRCLPESALGHRAAQIGLDGEECRWDAHPLFMLLVLSLMALNRAVMKFTCCWIAAIAASAAAICCCKLDWRS